MKLYRVRQLSRWSFIQGPGLSLIQRAKIIWPYASDTTSGCGLSDQISLQTWTLSWPLVTRSHKADVNTRSVTCSLIGQPAAVRLSLDTDTCRFYHSVSVNYQRTTGSIMIIIRSVAKPFSCSLTNVQLHNISCTESNFTSVCLYVSACHCGSGHIIVRNDMTFIYIINGIFCFFSSGFS